LHTHFYLRLVTQQLQPRQPQLDQPTRLGQDTLLDQHMLRLDLHMLRLQYLYTELLLMLYRLTLPQQQRDRRMQPLLHMLRPHLLMRPTRHWLIQRYNRAVFRR
jgi:hypothetical protein